MHNLEVPSFYNICIAIWISLTFTYLLHIIHVHLKAIDFTQNIYFFIKSANLYINAGYMSYIQLVHDIKTKLFFSSKNK